MSVSSLIDMCIPRPRSCAMHPFITAPQAVFSCSHRCRKSVIHIKHCSELADSKPCTAAVQ